MPPLLSVSFVSFGDRTRNLSTTGAIHSRKTSRPVGALRHLPDSGNPLLSGQILGRWAGRRRRRMPTYSPRLLPDWHIPGTQWRHRVLTARLPFPVRTDEGASLASLTLITMTLPTIRIVRSQTRQRRRALCGQFGNYLPDKPGARTPGPILLTAFPRSSLDARAPILQRRLYAFATRPMLDSRHEKISARHLSFNGGCCPGICRVQASPSRPPP